MCISQYKALSASNSFLSKAHALCMAANSIGQGTAGPSQSPEPLPRSASPERLASDNNYESSEEELEEDGFGLEEGMEPEGFSGPNEKIVKPLTPEALAAFKAAQDRAGVLYISRIPPGMRPAKVRHLMSQYGEIGKVYLQQEGTSASLLIVFMVFTTT